LEVEKVDIKIMMMAIRVVQVVVEKVDLLRVEELEIFLRIVHLQLLFKVMQVETLQEPKVHQMDILLEVVVALLLQEHLIQVLLKVAQEEQEKLIQFQELQ
jgi:hypothetical protein|tara:strand:- start:188 stop:490 length:303 start_codon:yes stop_codon:yes gene_type:complete